MANVKKESLAKAEVPTGATLNTQSVDVLAISRSQNIRIGTKTIPSIGGVMGADRNPVNVNLMDAKARRDLQNHLAFGAVIIVGYHST